MSADRTSAPEPLIADLVTALAGLPVGLMTVTMEYGLATAACLASTAAELVAVYRAHRPRRVVADSGGSADVITLYGNRISEPRT